MDRIGTYRQDENYSDRIVHSVQMQSTEQSLTRLSVTGREDQSLQVSIDRDSETLLVVREAASRLFRAYLPGLGFVESIQDTETEYRQHRRVTEHVDVRVLTGQEILLLSR